MITKKQVVEYHGIMKQAEALKGKSENMVKFRYAVSKNIQKFEPEIKALQKALEPNDEYKKYDTERIELCKKHANLDENGKPIIRFNQYDLVDKATGELKKDFTEAHDALKEEHKSAVDARKEQLDAYDKLLEEKSDAKLYKFNVNVMPDDVSGPLMTALLPFLEEDEQE